MNTPIQHIPGAQCQITRHATAAHCRQSPAPQASHCSRPRQQHLQLCCQKLSNSTPQVIAHAKSGSNSSDAAPTNQGGVLGILRRWQQDSRKMQKQLKSLGVAGVIAYGLFNTLYYTVAFLVVWFKVANVATGLGWAPAAQKAAEVFALVWAGSQVTKLLRAGAALACAPLIDQGLDRLGLQDKRKAYTLVVVGCIVLALVVMGLVIATHA